MAKFYVQCGQRELVLSTDSAESAALAVIDRFLGGDIWVYDDPDLTELDCQQHLMMEALLQLPTEIRVSERGFNRGDADSYSVPEMVQSWHRLLVGLRRLFSEAGVGRSAAVLAGARAIEIAVSRPKQPR